MTVDDIAEGWTCIDASEAPGRASDDAWVLTAASEHGRDRLVTSAPRADDAASVASCASRSSSTRDRVCKPKPPKRVRARQRKQRLAPFGG
eukprot:CAMPEP_0119270972 /NCGR_PEP_ID=MMETSP1329-20130426/7759_1 /TAXON_ID=114041 /ORGANISM="Genus nov. species nov., Strain RCC1024" /LENGTH=90 /DNA_ID=CAMNT_0007271007 /DNA_START=348 /DNA_END=617 /DNA_ORIENTATION=+